MAKLIYGMFTSLDGYTEDEHGDVGAKIVEPLKKRPWGLRKFTVEDLDGNRFYFHCDS